MKSPFLFSSYDRKILKNIYEFAKKKKITLYLVGGILRDLVFGRDKDNPDFDFCLKNKSITFGRKLARKTKSGFVVLDRGHGACRLIKLIRGKVYTFDFTDFRGKTLKEDLLHRDFTINTLALRLEHFSAKKEDLKDLIIDYHKGMKDLKARVIRAVNNKAFIEDPLRILRAFSFSAVLNFKIDSLTLKLLRSQKRRLSGVSFERIRDELFKIFDQPMGVKYLKQLDNAGILRVIIPEIQRMRNIGQGPYHHLDVWQHTLESVRELELLFLEIRNNRRIVDYLDEIISSGRRRRQLLKLAALLHDIGKPASLRRQKGKIIFHGHERIGVTIGSDIVRRLKLSNGEWEALRKIILWHLRPGFLADNAIVTPRAIFRYFRDTKEEALSVLLLSLADQRATKGPLATKESRQRHEKLVASLVKQYFKKKDEKKPRRLLDGNELMRRFKLKPSPLIGKILSELEELQAIGRVRNKDQALRISAKIIRKENQQK